MIVAFEGTRATLEVPDDPAFLAALAAAASGWSHRLLPDGADTDVVGSVVALGGGAYRITGPDGTETDCPATSAACGAMVDLVEAMMDEFPAHLFLHCASVEFAGRLVIFPSRSHAGKSTLVARLACAGRRVFGDDILRLAGDDRDGVALGIAPRIRLPLPASASEKFRRQVVEAITAADDRYAFVQPAGGLHAPFGTSAPLGAIVLLDRREGGAAAFGRAHESDILRTLVAQNFALAEPSEALLARLHALMQRLPCLVLRYSDLDEAADLLQRSFADWSSLPEPATDMRLPEPAPDDAPVAAAVSAVEPTVAYLRASGIALRAVGDELILAQPASPVIHHLNPIGTAVWALLGEPISARQAAALLAEAYPQVPRAAIEADVAALFAALAAAGFIHPAPGERPG